MASVDILVCQYHFLEILKYSLPGFSLIMIYIYILYCKLAQSITCQVFRCANATCGHFYHPHCAATMLHREDKVAAEELRKKIAVGESFACPIHKCCICKQVEDKKKSDLQFAVCRRCPTSYHQKCLPK